MKQHPAPRLSVIIPVWNGERYLAHAISSVLQQEGAPPLEIIVVDDGSEDQSAVVAESFGPSVRCLRVAHGGLASARNAGAKIASGEFLLHLDADDLLPPMSIESLMAEFYRSAPVDLVIGQMMSFISPDLDTETAARYRLPPGAQRGGLGSCVMRASFASRVGCFDISRIHGADLDWMARAIELGARVIVLPKIVHHRRIHGGNMSLRRERFETDRLGIVRAALNRRRAADNAM